MNLRELVPERRLPLVAGAIGSVCVTVGASQASSPFTEHSAGSWFFQWDLGQPAGGGIDERFLAMLLVYVGLMLLIGSWYAIVRTGRQHTLGQLALTLAAWAAPLLVVGPLFSHDAYSYAAQGEMLTKGLSPYKYGAASLRSGPWLQHVDPIWRHAIAPYGPGWERLVEGYVLVSGHRLLGVLVLLRITALLSLVVLAWGIPALARSTGHDPTSSFAWAVLNPLMLLTLLGGMHNDIVMLALVVAGLVAAQRGHPLLGTIACALGAEVKAPALLAVVFIGWWAGEGKRPASRAAWVAACVATAALVLTALSIASGLGWGWIHAALTPGKVVSWLDPATALGLALSHLSHALGLGADEATWVAAARAAGLAAAAVTALFLLVRSDRRSGPHALGVSFLTLALLGPVVWPWYETWGIALMSTAPDAFGQWKRRLVIGLSVLGCIADFPSGRILSGGSPALVVAGWAVLGLCACLFFRVVVRCDHAAKDP